MNAKERFYAAMEYQCPDRPPMIPLEAQKPVWETLYDYFGITSYKDDPEYLKPGVKYFGLCTKAHEEFQTIVGEDFRHIEPKYVGPELPVFEDGSWEGLWGERYRYASLGWGAFVEDIFRPYQDVKDVEELRAFRVPSADWYDYSNIAELCDQYEGFALFTGDPGHGDFINGNAFNRGVEQVLMDIALEDPVYLEMTEQRSAFFYEKIKRTLEAGKGKIDMVYFGDDLGTQIAPIISPKQYDKLIAPHYKKLFDMVHSFGARAIMHSCGSIRPFIPRQIELGLDIQDTIQTDAADMDIVSIHQEFYKKIAFAGTLSIQSVLRTGTPEDVTREVEMRKSLFRDGGLMLGPANIMQTDMPIENFVAMCKAIGTM